MLSKIKFLLLSFLLAVSVAHAGDLKELKIIVPVAPGGNSDQTARIVQTALSEEMKIPVTVEFKLGAGGAIATSYVNNAPVTEKLLYVSALGIVSNALKEEEYAKLKNVNFLVNFGFTESILVVSKKSGIRNWDDFLRVSKTRQLTYGSAGIGTTPHIFSEIMGDKLNRKFIHVPFKGQTAMLPMIINGDVDFSIANRSTVIQHIQSASMLPIAVVSHSRDPDLPFVPTFAEKKIPGFEDYNWISMFTNQPVDSEDYQTIQTALHKVLRDPKVKAQMTEIGYNPKVAMKRGSDKDFIAHERQRLLKDTQNLKLD